MGRLSSGVEQHGTENQERYGIIEMCGDLMAGIAVRDKGPSQGPTGELPYMHVQAQN